MSGKPFIGYPMVGGTGGPHRVDALLVSNERGLVAFDLVEGSDLGDFRARQDEAFNLLDAKLRTEPGLTRRRYLQVTIDRTGSIRISHEAKIASWSLIK